MPHQFRQAEEDGKGEWVEKEDVQLEQADLDPEIQWGLGIELFKPTEDRRGEERKEKQPSRRRNADCLFSSPTANR